MDTELLAFGESVSPDGVRRSDGAAHEPVQSALAGKLNPCRLFRTVAGSLLLVIGWTGLEDVLDENVKFRFFASSGTLERNTIFVVFGMSTVLLMDTLHPGRSAGTARRPGRSARERPEQTADCPPGGEEEQHRPHESRRKFVVLAEVADELGSIVMWTGSCRFIELAFVAMNADVWYGRLFVSFLAFVLYILLYGSFCRR